MKAVGSFSDDKVICASDWETYLKLSIKGNVGYIKEPLVVYRWHPGNLSNFVNIKAKFYERLYVIEKIFREYESDVKIPALQDQVIKNQWGNFIKSLPSLKASMGRNLEILDCIKEVYSGRREVFFNIRLFPYLILALFLPSSLLKVLRKLKNMCSGFANV